jgi:hypothetical protein
MVTGDGRGRTTGGRSMWRRPRGLTKTQVTPCGRGDKVVYGAVSKVEVGLKGEAVWWCVKVIVC